MTTPARVGSSTGRAGKGNGKGRMVADERELFCGNIIKGNCDSSQPKENITKNFFVGECIRENT